MANGALRDQYLDSVLLGYAAVSLVIDSRRSESIASEVQRSERVGVLNQTSVKTSGLLWPVLFVLCEEKKKTYMSVLETASRRDGQLLNRLRFLRLQRSAFCFLRSSLQPLQDASRGRESVERTSCHFHCAVPDARYVHMAMKFLSLPSPSSSPPVKHSEGPSVAVGYF